jgi:gliding motility-associated-like protein
MGFSFQLKEFINKPLLPNAYRARYTMINTSHIYTSLLIALLCWWNAFAPVQGQQLEKAIINEWSHGGAQQQEWVEILVIEDGLSLEGWTLRDGGTDTEFYTFGPGVSNLPKGTLVLIYNPLQRDASLSNLNTSDALVPCSGGGYWMPDPALRNQIRSNWGIQDAYSNGGTTTNNRQDNPRLFDRDRNLVHDFDNNNQPDLVAKRPIGGQAISYMGANPITDIYNPNMWVESAFDATTVTPGAPNGGANSRFIDNLRSTTNAFTCITLRGEVGTDTMRISECGDTARMTINVTNPHLDPTRFIEAQIIVASRPNFRPRANFKRDYQVFIGNTRLEEDTLRNSDDTTSYFNIRIPANTASFPIEVVAVWNPTIEDDKFLNVRLATQIPPANALYAEPDAPPLLIRIADVDSFRFRFTPATPGPLEICELDSQAVEVIVPNKLPGFTYRWNSNPSGTPEAMVISSNTLNAVMKPLVTTSYTVTPVNAQCDARKLAEAASSFIINVKEAPDVQAQTSKTTICAGDTTQIRATGAVTYKWMPTTNISNPDTSHPVASFANNLTSTTYTVTGTGSNSCTNTSTVTIFYKPGATISLSQEAPVICKKDTAEIKVELPRANEVQSYRWEPQTGLDSTNTRVVKASPEDTTEYTVTISDLNGCTASTKVTVMVWPLPEVETSVDQDTIREGKFTFVNVSGEGISYTWLPSDGLVDTASVRTRVQPAKTITYTVRATGTNGCTNTATAQVQVIPYEFNVPSVFTPNGDGVNETFDVRIDPTNVQTYAITISDRTGNLMFSKDNMMMGWNGQSTNGNEATPGVYFYVIRITTKDNQQITKSGNVTLLR